jgi:hypothetical protein
VVAEDGRFRMLETIRAYVEELLSGMMFSFRVARRQT